MNKGFYRVQAPVVVCKNGQANRAGDLPLHAPKKEALTLANGRGCIME